MMQQENIDILGTFSSNRLDLQASLSETAFETLIPSTIFRDLGEGPPSGSIIRLANPIKDRFNSFDESLEPFCQRDTNIHSRQNNLSTQYPGSAHHQTEPYHHDSVSVILKPLGCSLHHSTTNKATPAGPDSTSLLSATPHIDFSRYFSDFSSVAIDCEPLLEVQDHDDDASIFSCHANSILSSTISDDDEEGFELALYQGSISWNSYTE